MLNVFMGMEFGEDGIANDFVPKVIADSCRYLHNPGRGKKDQ